MTASALVPRAEDAAEIDYQIRDFIIRTENERNELYQDMIRCTVSRTSPLLLDVIGDQEIDLDECISLMVPPTGWPVRVNPQPWSLAKEPLLRDSQRGRAFGSTKEDLAFYTRFKHGGAVVRPPSHPDGRFGVRVSGSSLEACFDLGTARLVVGAGNARMRLPEGIPETVLAAAVGRRVNAVVGHRLFDDRDYVIERLGWASKNSAASIVIFDDGDVEIDLRTVGAHS